MKIHHVNVKFKKLLVCFIVVLFANLLNAQNTAITDSANYNAKSSAVLDVQSVHKGFLAPRMSTSQRMGISSPAEGLLVYDITESMFYVYSSGWKPLSSETLWLANGDKLYTTGSGVKVGVGTNSPMGRFIIQGDATAPDEPLFEVKNSDGQSIFAVYEDSVSINFIETDKGVKGGFAVGGLTPGKRTPRDYLRITPDSVRIYVDTSQSKGVKGGFAVGGLTPGKGAAIDLMKVTSDSVRVYINDNLSKGVKGGFAVGGLTPAKSGGNQYFQINPDSARIYVKDGAKGVKGGFAVGGLTPGKGVTDHYLTIERDSARIYVENSSKGVKGGFAVGGLTPGKSESGSFLSLNRDNYFIGDSTGVNITSGLKNSVFGHGAAYNLNAGNYSIYIGYKSGFSNDSGSYNTFLGYQSGYNNTADYNVFIGSKAGLENTTGLANTFIGEESGKSNQIGNGNTFVGQWSGASNLASYNSFYGTWSGVFNSTGENNVFIGSYAGGWNTTGNKNVYIGRSAGNSANLSTDSCNVFIGYESGINELGSNKLYIESSSSSTPLIYGDFNLDNVKINGSLDVTNDLHLLDGLLDIYGSDGSSGQVLSSTGSGVDWIDVPNGHALDASDGSPDNVVYVDASGEVGINDQSPSYELDVNGQGRFTDEIYANDGVVFGTASSIEGVIQYTGSDFQGYNGSGWVSLTGSGGTGDIEGVTVGNGLSGGGTSGTVTLSVGAGDGITVNSSDIDVNVSDIIGTGLLATSNNIEVYALQSSDGSPDNVVYVNASGNVGINDVSPSYDLDVNGNTRVTSLIYANGGVALGSGSTSTTGMIRWSGSDFEGYNGSSWQSLTSPCSLDASDGSPDDVVYVDASGEVGINDVTPSYTLDVNGTARVTGQMRVDGTSILLDAGNVVQTSSYDYWMWGNWSYDNFFQNKVGVARDPVTNLLEVAGAASKSTAGDWLANSDRRIKTDIKDIDNSFETILKLRPVTFRYTKEWLNRNQDIKDKVYYNFIAQEFAEVFPKSVYESGEFLSGDNKSILQIDTYNAQVVTIKAVQDLILENEKKSEEIENLKNENTQLKLEIENIKKMVMKLQK